MLQIGILATRGPEPGRCPGFGVFRIEGGRAFPVVRDTELRHLRAVAGSREVEFNLHDGILRRRCGGQSLHETATHSLWPGT
jgi:hypothetical protein